MRVNIKDTVAIAVDFQEKLMPVVQNTELIIRNASILLAGLKELGVPMHVTQQYTKGLGSTIQPIADIIRQEANDTSVLPHIEKIRFSAYEDIKAHIEGRKNVIICGVEAHICVLQTVIDLAEAGYTPILVVDCISSRKETDKQFATERAKQEGAILTTYEALLFELLKEAGTEKSKAIQKLIK